MGHKKMKTQTLKKIFIFRHGETDWNKEFRFQGHLDVPLNEHGRKQAESLVAQLQDKGLQAILSSDLSRAKDTGEILARGLGGIPVHIDERLREAHLGEAQGKTAKEIEAHYGEDLARRWKSSHPTDADVSYPGGETGAQIMNRSLLAIQEFLVREQLSVIGVATHGGVIRRVMQAILPPGSPSVAIPNCVLYHLQFESLTGTWQKI